MFNKYQPQHLKRQEHKAKKKELSSIEQPLQINAANIAAFSAVFNNIPSIARKVEMVVGFGGGQSIKLNPIPTTFVDVTSFSELLALNPDLTIRSIHKSDCAPYYYTETVVATVSEEMYQQVKHCNNDAEFDEAIKKLANIEQRASKIETALANE